MLITEDTVVLAHHIGQAPADRLQELVVGPCYPSVHVELGNGL